jgi:hypothetical protein
MSWHAATKSASRKRLFGVEAVGRPASRKPWKRARLAHQTLIVRNIASISGIVTPPPQDGGIGRSGVAERRRP